MILDAFEKVSKKQGTGEITIFFPVKTISASGMIIPRDTPSKSADITMQIPEPINRNLCGQINLNNLRYCFIANYVIIYIDFCRAICYYLYYA